jgi:hypothetical protein
VASDNPDFMTDSLMSALGAKEAMMLKNKSILNN